MRAKVITYTLYRMFDGNGRLLYIGLTNNTRTRLKNHADDKAWWGQVHNVTLEHFPSRTALEDAERAAIQSERPLHNVVHNASNEINDERAQWECDYDALEQDYEDRCAVYVLERLYADEQAGLMETPDQRAGMYEKYLNEAYQVLPFKGVPA